MSATLSPGLWFCAPQMIVRSPLPSFTLHTDNLSEPGTLSRVRICATTTPSNSPASFCTLSTSRPSIVSRSASSSGDQSKSTYCFSQLSVTFIFLGNLRLCRRSLTVSISNSSLASRSPRCAAGENIGNRPSALRKRRVIILAEQRRDGGGDLALRVRFGLRSFACRRRVRTDHCDPVAFRVGHFFAVLFPIFRTMAAAMVRGDDERRFAAILWQ